MKITFPHMGNAHIAIRALLEELRLEVISPPPISERTLELGTKYSPDFACLPLKINLGNFIEALENGADTILMAGGWGPCRFGYYAQVERDILHDLGYDCQMIILEAPDSRVSELFGQLKALGQNVSAWEAFKAVKFAWKKLHMVEEIEKEFIYTLPRAKNKKRAEEIYDKGLEEISNSGRGQIEQAAAMTLQHLRSLEKYEADPLKIGLVGEIYTVLEPAANYHMVRSLGRLNVEVDNSIYISEWLNEHLLGGILKKSNHQQIIKCAHPYLGHFVGGHGIETVGCAVNYARQGFDGVIQIGPLTCMPEIVAQSILNRVSREEKIPCMTLYFDEHAGAAGIQTRLEAFTDMLSRRKTFANMALKK